MLGKEISQLEGAAVCFSQELSLRTCNSMTLPVTQCVSSKNTQLLALCLGPTSTVGMLVISSGFSLASACMAQSMLLLTPDIPQPSYEGTVINSDVPQELHSQRQECESTEVAHPPGIHLDLSTASVSNPLVLTQSRALLQPL